MEGVSSEEAASYAGLQKLDKLVVLYDSNDINPDGGNKVPLQCFVTVTMPTVGILALVEDGTDGSYPRAAIQSG